MGSREIEQKTSSYPKEHKPHWSTTYVDGLKDMGWRFVNGKEGGIGSRFIAYHDEQTPGLLNNWRQNHDPVETSIVVVAPSSNMEQLPARALGYAATALSFIESIQKSGVNVSALRIMSPCKVNALANGGNREQQILNAERFQSLVNQYKSEYLPELSGVDVTLDTGLPVTNRSLDSLNPKAQQVLSNYPQLSQSLLDVSLRYRENGNSEDVDGSNLSPLIYLLAHPEAWGYSDEEILFAPNGQRRINFVPGSELRYLHAIKLTEGIWKPSTNKEISTVVSGKNLFAPYYPIWENEPTIGDLKDVETSPSVQIGRLKRLDGRSEVAEIIQNLNQLKSHQEQANHRHKTLRTQHHPLPLNQIISSI